MALLDDSLRPRWWALALFGGLLWAPHATAVLDAESRGDIDRALHSGAFGPVKSLLIQQGDVLVFEGYYRGGGEQNLHLLNSVTKSIGVTLIGAAQRRGLLRVDQTMRQLLPQYNWNDAQIAARAELTLDHVLQMRHGLSWDEWTYGFTDPRNHAAMMFGSPDWYRFTLSRPTIDAPGTRFRYSTGASTLMSGVLRAATGKTPQTLFREWLADPLGIERFDWELWSPSGPGTGLRQFPFGDAPLGVGLWLRPRDLLKIGMLYLRRGVDDHGVRLLDESWIERSWSPYSNTQNDPHFAPSAEDAGYGWQWWFRRLNAADGRSHDCWYADGAGRQYLLICPQIELVVASTADAYDYSGPGVFTLLREQVLPKLNHPVHAPLSGFYYDPASSGQGVSIEVIEATQQVALAWYTFEGGAQRWYVAAGSIEDQQVHFSDIISLAGGEFLAPGAGPSIHHGRATLRWLHCDRAELSYELEHENREGVYTLHKISGCPNPTP